MGLPDISGYEVAKRLRAEHPNVRIVAVTGFSDDEAKARVKEANFDQHVVKPLRLPQLQALLKELGKNAD